MDLLSKTLGELAFDQLNITDFWLRAPWSINTEGFGPGFNLIVREGTCALTLPDGKRQSLSAGNSVMFPRGGTLEYASAFNQPSVPLTRVWDEGRYRSLDDSPAAFHIKHWGGDGSLCRILGFAFELSEGAQELMLPHLPSYILQKVPPDLHGFIVAFDSYLDVNEKDSAIGDQGQFAERARFAEGIVISQLRQHIMENEYNVGWIAGSKHPKLSSALSAIHQDYQSRWSVGSLASRCGMSRASFAHQFAAVLGQTPMQYLNDHRVRQARKLLTTSDTPISQIAYATGHASEDTMRRNFKKIFGQTPRDIRKGLQT